MTGVRWSSLLAVIVVMTALMVSGCGTGAKSPEPIELPEKTNTGVSDTPETASPMEASIDNFPALQSRDCADVAAFYAEAIAARDFARAALVWNDPAVNGAMLQRAFAAYPSPRIAFADPQVEGAAGSSYCTISGSLTDARNTAISPVAGKLLLRRVNDVDGATAQQLRWTIRSGSLPENGAPETGEPS